LTPTKESRGTARDRDRIYVQKDKHADFQRLSQGDDPVFETMKDVWVLAAAMGFRAGRRQPLKGTQHIGFTASLSSQEDLPLLQAIAVAETADVKVLADQGKVLKIAEEYANVGIDLLIQDERQDANTSIRTMARTVVEGSGGIAQHKAGGTKDGESSPANVPTSELVRRKESARLEFKETARWHTKANMHHKDIELEVLRSVAGFLNKDGGTLLIGVTDDNELTGFERDFALFKSSRQNPHDAFETWFTGLLDERIGAAPNASFVRAGFEAVDGKDVFRVDVLPSDGPVYVRWEDDELFFVRTNNRTRRMKTQDAANFIASHWPRT
jgi:dnd system-associated protein 4